MQISKMTKAIGSAILSARPLPTSGPYPTGDPYLFCVYHKDDYPAGNDKMEAPTRGNGSDFNPSAPYRMYHGSKIPGFPQHPHRGKLVFSLDQEIYKGVEMVFRIVNDNCCVSRATNI